LKELRQNETALNEKLEVYQKLQSKAKQRDKESCKGMSPKEKIKNIYIEEDSNICCFVSIRHEEMRPMGGDSYLQRRGIEGLYATNVLNYYSEYWILDIVASDYSE